MHRTQPAAGVSVEVLGEDEEILEPWFGEERVTGHRRRMRSLEQGTESARQIGHDLENRTLDAAAGRVFDAEPVRQADGVLAQRRQQQPVHREPDGASPVRVPPEQRRPRLGRLVSDGRPTHVEHVGMLFVPLRHRPDPMVGEELAGIENAREDATEPSFPDRRQQHPGVGATSDRVTVLISVFDEPVVPTREVGKPIEDPLREVLDRKEWNEPDHRTNLDLLRSGLCSDDVVEEAVVVRPHAMVVEGSRDVGEVFEELGGQVLIRVVVVGQDQGHPQHVETEHRHPCGGIGLLEHRAVHQIG